MIRRRGFGLRPRLLAALVITSAVTLGVAALTLLPPLQDRLAQTTTNSLTEATRADSDLFRQKIESSLRGTLRRSRPDRISQLVTDLNNRVDVLRQRTDARVVLADSIPNDEPIYDTEFSADVPTRDILQALLRDDTVVDRSGDQVTVAIPLTINHAVALYRGVREDGRPADERYVLLTTKPLSDVTTAVHQVRNAVLAAAGVGLLVAVLLGIALATTIGRRLARLRAAAVRVATEGPDAPAPRDDGLDEVGDLARALASMQRALRRQEAARRSFVSTASHELRTPLTMLQGTLELLEEDLRGGQLDYADAEEQVARAQRELRRLARLSSELLDLSRLDAAVPMREEPVELAELCRAVTAEFELRAHERDLTLEVTTPPGPCWGRGDPDAVARVARILLDNALRHTAEGSTVRVVPSYHGDHATVEVTDQGPGVAPDDRERIFERFERGSALSGEGGFGLGLAIGRELARRMGGELMLGEDPAVGARFVLQLPIEMPTGSKAEPETAPTAG